MSDSDSGNEAKKPRVDEVEADTKAVETPKVESEDYSEPPYAVVKESEDGEPMELPCSVDKTLGLSTLTHAFPGAHGLKYKNPKTGASRALLMDPSGLNFVCPPGGWDGKVFVVIFKNKPSESAEGASGGGVSQSSQSVAASGKGDAKRRKVAAPESDSSDDEDHPDKGQKRERLADTHPQDLLILGLPYSLQEEAVKQYFEAYGPVRMVDIKKGSDGKSKGFGFVLMENFEDQMKVLEQSHTIGGRRCEVKVPDQGYSKPGQMMMMQPQIPKVKSVSKKIFVGRLTEKHTHDVLKEFFGKECAKINPKATVEDIYIPQPLRGFGFVTFSHADVARKLSEMPSIIIDDVSVALSIAVPRQEDPFRGHGHAMQAAYGYGGYGYGRMDLKPRGDWGGDEWGLEQMPSQPPYYNKHKRPLRGDEHWAAQSTGGNPFGGSYRFPSPVPVGGVPFQQGSANIANGIDALNLNRQQPDAAWSYYYPPRQQQETPQSLFNIGIEPPSGRRPGTFARVPDS